MEGQGGWSEAEIHRAMESGKSVTVKLDHPVPVVLFYSTVVAEPGGRTVFLADLYGYDAALQRALSNRAARIARLLH